MTLTQRIHIKVRTYIESRHLLSSHLALGTNAGTTLGAEEMAEFLVTKAVGFHVLQAALGPLDVVFVDKSQEIAIDGADGAVAGYGLVAIFERRRDSNGVLVGFAMAGATVRL